MTGQSPRSATSIEILTADGEQHDATVGSGFYIAWVSTGETPSNVVEVDARDGSGKLIARLVDLSGLQPGSSAVTQAN